MSQVPAGWYPDPLNAAQRRYWDGAQWTQNTAPPATPPVAQQPATQFAPAAQQPATQCAPAAQQPATQFAPAAQQPAIGSHAPSSQFTPGTQFAPAAQQPATGSYAPSSQFTPGTQFAPAAQQYATGAYAPSSQFAPAAGTPGPTGFTPITAYSPEPARYSYEAVPAKKKGRAGTVVALLVGGVVAIVGVGYMVNGLVSTVATPAVNETVGLALDTSAKADAVALGDQLTLYYVDHAGPPPTITVSGSKYVLNIPGEAAIEVGSSKGVTIGGVSGSGTSDWCVWVTAAEGQLKDFQFSSLAGLGPGHC